MEIEPRVMCDVFGVRASRRLRSGGADGKNGYGTHGIYFISTCKYSLLSHMALISHIYIDVSKTHLWGSPYIR